MSKISYAPRVAQFVPGDNPKALRSMLDPAKAVDMWIVNWEAGVADKAGARQCTLDFLTEHGQALNVPTIVRLNGWNTPYATPDLKAVENHRTSNQPLGLSGMMFPLIESASDLYNWTARVETITHGFPLAVHILMETPKAVLNAGQIASALSRVKTPGHIFAGLADYTTAVGMWETAEEPERNCSLFLQTVVAAARAFGLQAIGPVPPNIEADTEEWATMCRKLGFSGIMTVHPKQRDGGIRGFTPSAARVERAQDRLEALVQSHGNATRLDGVVVEVPMCGPDLEVARIAVRADLMDPEALEVYERIMKS